MKNCMINKNDHLTRSASYCTTFWNLMRNQPLSNREMESDIVDSTMGIILPVGSDKKLQSAIQNESVLRGLATCLCAYKGSLIFAKDCDDLGAWIPEGGTIPLQDGMNDFTKISIDSHKLAVFVKLDDDFIHDATFDIEDYLIKRLAKSFAKAEDKGFLTGTGPQMPTGILGDATGAETGVTTATLSFDDVLRLYHSLDTEYRKNAVWMMNDETALTLRMLKDSGGNYLWNATDNTILGKPVVISYDMPSMAPGAKPIVFGDFSYYWIIDRSPIGVRTLKEQFATLDQVGYLAIQFLDGKLVRREALKVLQIAGA